MAKIRAVIIPVLDPNPDPELGHFLTFFNSNSNSESSCYIVLDPNPDPNLDSELRHFLTFSSPNSNSESGKKRNYNSSSPRQRPGALTRRTDTRNPSYTYYPKSSYLWAL